MKTTSIKTIINELEAKTPIGAVEGRITAIYERKASPPDAEKPWSFQTGMLQASDGEKIKIKWVGCRPADETLKGQPVRITSITNTHGNITGVYADDEEYQGKVTRLLRLTPSHTIQPLTDARPIAGIAAAVEDAIDMGQPKPAAPAPAASTADHDKKFTHDVMVRIAKLAGLQSKCYDAAVHNAHRIYKNHGIAIMPGAVGIMGDKIMMEVIRRTDIDLLPIDPYATTPFKGQPLDQLIPSMRQQIAKGRAEIEMESQAIMAHAPKIDELSKPFAPTMSTDNQEFEPF